MSENRMFFAAMGGLDEIGMNTYIYGYGDDLKSCQKLIVDMGINFPNNNEYPGTDIQYVNPEIIKRYLDNCLGIFVTHSHEDHIGAIPAVLLPIKKTLPIFCSSFDVAVLRKKFKERGMLCKTYVWQPTVSYADMLQHMSEHCNTHSVLVDITEFITSKTRVPIGSMSLEVRFIYHSIFQTKSFVLRIPEDKNIKPVFHTTDYKIGSEAFFKHPINVDTPNVDEDFLNAMREEGIGVMVGDSTNTGIKGWSGTEDDVERSLVGQLSQIPYLKLIAITSFGSHVERIMTICKVGKRMGRKVAVAGRSPMEFLESAQSAKLAKNLELITLEEAMSLPKEKVMLVISGSQLHDLSFANRLINDKIRGLKLEANDALVFSSRTIPGNEIRIATGKNRAVEKGVHVFDSLDFLVHTSGHSCEEDIKFIIQKVNPQTYIPIHGDAIHRYRGARIAKASGVNDVRMLYNCEVADITNPADINVIKRIKDCTRLSSGNIILNSDGQTIKERRDMVHGIISVCIIRDKNGKLYTAPIITIVGVADDTTQLLEGIRGLLRKFIKTPNSPNKLSQNVCNGIKSLCRRIIGYLPIVKVHVE